MFRVMVMTEENETQFEQFLTDLSHLEDQLAEAKKQIIDCTDVSLVLSLEVHIEDIETEIQNLRNNARTWTDLFGNDRD